MGAFTGGRGANAPITSQQPTMNDISAYLTRAGKGGSRTAMGQQVVPQSRGMVDGYAPRPLPVSPEANPDLYAQTPERYGQYPEMRRMADLERQMAWYPSQQTMGMPQGQPQYAVRQNPYMSAMQQFSAQQQPSAMQSIGAVNAYSRAFPGKGAGLPPMAQQPQQPQTGGMQYYRPMQSSQTQTMPSGVSQLIKSMPGLASQLVQSTPGGIAQLIQSAQSANPTQAVQPGQAVNPVSRGLYGRDAMEARNNSLRATSQQVQPKRVGRDR